MHDLSSIHEATILRGLDPGELEQLASIARPVEVRQGERLFARGEKTGNLFVVRSGRVALTVVLHVLGEEAELPVEQLGGLDAFGWSAVVEPYASIYSSWCIEDGEVVAFPADELERIMDAQPSLGLTLSRNLAALIGSRVRALQNLWLEEVEQHMDRVQYWAQTEVNRTWTVQHPGPARGLRQRWSARHGFRSVHN